MVDKSLISRCLKNDRKAYEELYNQTLPYMVVLCRRYRLLENDMEDMLQEIYSEVFIKLKNYDASKGEFKPWFRKLGLYTILKGFRKKKVKIVQMDVSEHYLTTENETHDEFDNYDILSLVDKLPLGYKTVFNLSKDGLDHSEISNYLGISKSTSRSQLARAKQMLRYQITNLKCKSL
jgi:RNA polymerase sigma-70 factor (ECF subfamily)